MPILNVGRFPHGSKVHKAAQNTDRTDRDHSHRGERLAKQAIFVCSSRSRYLRVAGDKAACAGDDSDQYRPQNILQIAVLPTMRAVRAVFCWML